MNLLQMLEAASYTAKRRKAKASPVRDHIMAYITANPRCTMSEIQKATDTSNRSIATWMYRLHKAGMISRQEYSTTTYGARPRYIFWSNQDANQSPTTDSMDGQR